MKIVQTYKWIVTYILGVSFLWALPFSASVLKAFDSKCAYVFNSLLSRQQAVQHYWAFTNSPLMDWIFDLIIVSFFLYHLIRRGERTRISQFVRGAFIVAYAFFAHFSKAGMEHLLHIKRSSPSVVLSNLHCFHDSIPNWGGRIQTFASYPADHAHTIIIMVLSIVLIAGRRVGLICFLIAIPFFLPRLVVGAHWISDVYAGSVPFSLIMYGWLLTPGIFEKVIAFLLEKLGLTHINRKELPDTSHTA